MKMKAIIEEVIVQPDKIQPIIVDFQIGKLKDDEVKSMSCGLFRDQTRDKTVLALSNGRIVYKGYEPDPEKESVRTMLVLHNKKTGKVRLIEAERWQVTPVLDKPVIEDSRHNVDEKIVMLNKQFGSKKVKRRTEQFEKMKVDVDAVKDQLEKAVLNVEIDKMDLSNQLPANESAEAALLPPCNRDATNVKDVYNVYDIIPRSKLETLYEHAMEVLNGNVEGKSKFFKHTLRSIQSDLDNANKIALLLYIEMINAWFVMPLRDAKKRDVVVCQVSEEVNQYIIDTYSVASANGRSRPNTMKDKGLIHCMILALTVSNFMLDLDSFREMLGIRTSLKKLTDLAKIIGATASKEDKKVMVLKVPLPKPVSLVRKGKRKGKSDSQMLI
ncbi:hypothetical protein DMN91_009942 [Ooceraea biroi]|uniref:DNA-directed RNA polymerase I subunit RPA49 n=1 Tax=Ooceraea biroi TaxID=2015173 RepID=A0A026WDZ9_OOCBI|nr:DNA-directed RNA polymerase I subunit RPA49 [Ooceraea biroi]RLU17705.1 hypothetical protein DMN91_009942 [Ooceraea biroi]